MNDALLKPMLTTKDQIAHLKSKGVRFEECSESEAESLLTHESYLFRFVAYRKLFSKRVGGDHDGEYVNLDFAYLNDLFCIDRQMRYTLLPMTLDIEHSAKSKIMNLLASSPEEDGYSIVADYLESIGPHRRTRFFKELEVRKSDVYCGALVERYKDCMPTWVMFETVTFGTFVDFYRFCAQRWHDEKLTDEHYLLKQTKALRNASAHSLCIANGFAEGGKTDIRSPKAFNDALIATGVSKRTRRSKMSNPRMRQIATVLYMHQRLVTSGPSKQRACADLGNLVSRMHLHFSYYERNDAVRSSFEFMGKLIDSWF